MHRSTWIHVICLFALACAVPAQAQSSNKDKGDFGSVELKDKDYHLIESSEEMYHQFQRRGMRYRDADLEAWLQSIGDRLVREPTDFYQEYRFFLIRDPSPNAFALPDGQIYVHTGLISRLDNEAQLASLLAHEVNHVAGHHGILGYRSQKKKAAAGLIVGIVVAGVAGANSWGGWGDVAQIMVGAGFQSSIFGYSRALEKEADVKAYEQVLQAGYDVREMPRLYEILGEDHEGLQPRLNGKWSTHPDLLSRADYMTAIAEETPAEQLETLTTGDDTYRKKVRPLALLSVEDYITDNFARTAIAVARELVEEDATDPHGFVALGNAYVALGFRAETREVALSDKEKRKEQWRLAKLTREEEEKEARESPTGQANLTRNLAAAESAYQSALQLQPEMAEAFRGLGEVYQQRGDLKQSGQAYVRYLKLSPDAPDRGVIMTKVKEMAAQLRSAKGE